MTHPSFCSCPSCAPPPQDPKRHEHERALNFVRMVSCARGPASREAAHWERRSFDIQHGSIEFESCKCRLGGA
jgi:hypothetical protein